MRSILALPLAAAFALAACGGGGEEGEATSGEGISADDVVAQAEGIVQPRPGEYRTSLELIEFDMPGISDAMKDQMRGVAQSGLAEGNTFCLTSEQAERGPREMVENMAEGNCTFDRFDVSGNTIQSEMRCTAEDGTEGAVKMSGEMSAESSDMTMEVDQQMGQAGDVRMKMRVRSERIGDCA